jgi:spore coat polysaccharide biosynthesis predicted glycosyltransferase SpsG
MRIAIHAAAGNNFGLGHLKRCLCVAEELRGLSYKVEFLVDNDLYSNLIHSSGFVTRTKIDTDQRYRMIIVDKYNVREPILTSYKKKCNILVRIDDASPAVIKDMVSDVLINGKLETDIELGKG